MGKVSRRRQKPKPPSLQPVELAVKERSWKLGTNGEAPLGISRCRVRRVLRETMALQERLTQEGRDDDAAVLSATVITLQKLMKQLKQLAAANKKTRKHE